MKTIPFSAEGKRIFAERRATQSKDDPSARCLPTGLPVRALLRTPFKIIQTPPVMAILYESRTTFRQILTDGRPYDHDYGDARYAREDVREALTEAKVSGITPFCITIDRESESELRDLYGDVGYTIIDDVMTHRCMLDQELPMIAESIPHDPEQVFDPAFLAEFSTDTWKTYRHVGDAFAANAIGPYAQTAPLRIYQGDADEIVPPWTTDAVVEALRKGGDEVDYVVVPNGTHGSVALGFLASPQTHTDDAIAWLRAQLVRYP